MWFSRTGKKSASATPATRPAELVGEEAATDLSGQIAIALRHHQGGRLADAEAGYRKVLEADAENVDALHFLGVIAYQRNDFERAAMLISRAISGNSSNAPAHNNLGNVFNSQGKLDRAIACYRDAIALQPDYLDAYINIGGVLKAKGMLDDAMEWFQKAVSLAPNFPSAQSGLGEILAAKGRFEEAAACYRKGIELKPDSAGLYSNLGNVLRSRGLMNDDQKLLSDAIDCYHSALTLNPDLPEARSNLGNVLRDVGRLDEAIACYRQALSLNPEFPEACANLGSALDEQGRRDEAIGWLRRAVELQSDSPGALSGLANVLKNAGQVEEAIACYRQALALKPASTEVLYQLGNTLREQDRLDGAIDCYRNVLSLDPEHVQARWALAMCSLPAAFDVNSELENCRKHFSRQLDELDNWFDSTRIANGFKAVGVQTPFYLAYQEENNRDLLRRHGALCARLMANWLDRQPVSISMKLRRKGRINVGIVSRHFRNHSVWNAIVKGWFQKLDRERFALWGFYLGPDQDEETRYAKEQAERFEQGRGTLLRWVETIAHDSPDILVYPEIGMDPMTVKLASLRLAPVQISTWGHPETSGLPTIDYYLSAEDMEPANAQQYYTEKLVMLPHLGCYVEPRRIVPLAPDLERLGIKSGVPVLLCPGVPFKYAPQFDWIFPEIASRLGSCCLVFFTHNIPEQSEKLRRRLEREFRSRGLRLKDFVAFIPWQDWGAFHGLLASADVYLDTIGFSGFNTAMQAVDCGLPVVTRKGRFLRGMLASGILKRMGLDGLIAESEEAYIALAVRLAQDSIFRTRVRRQIMDARHLLRADVAPIRALENFLSKVARPVSTT
jgi:predicted O-linked N-acetylglucosamine transferase (SPINDLY family)